MAPRRFTSNGTREDSPGQRPAACLAAFLLATLAGGPAAAQECGPIIVDGAFTDWSALAPVYQDAVGDAAPGCLDIGRVWIADDARRLYLRFETGVEWALQSANSLSLYLDTDDDATTGQFVWPIGAELRWDFGSRSGEFFPGGAPMRVTWPQVGFIALPAYTSREFEICLDRAARPDGVRPLFTGGVVRAMLVDRDPHGDGAPESGAAIPHAFDRRVPPPLDTLGLEKTRGACRLVTYNVCRDGILNPSKQPAFERILRAVDPDVIVLQEVYGAGGESVRALIESWLGGIWTAGQVNDLVLLTRGLLQETWVLARRRAAAFLVTPPAGWAAEMLVINAHLSCCEKDGERQAQADAIMAFVRDARTKGGEFDLSARNAIVIAGDMNFVGLASQRMTLLTGDIEDEDAYGPDFDPDWDGSGLSDCISRQPASPLAYTWVAKTSEYSPGRLDLVLHTDSNARVAASFVLETAALPGSCLRAYDLQAEDSEMASDHLAHVVDLLPLEDGAQPGGLAARWRFAAAGPNPSVGRVDFLIAVHGGITAEAGEVPATVSLRPLVLDAAGRVVRRMTPLRLGSGLHRLSWDGRDERFRVTAAGVYWITADETDGLRSGSRGLRVTRLR
ncbi:MAG: endonuclease/exonuclease/phosphatase family protein [Candidatus Eisenbacteria bacterium]